MIDPQIVNGEEKKVGASAGHGGILCVHRGDRSHRVSIIISLCVTIAYSLRRMFALPPITPCAVTRSSPCVALAASDGDVL